MPWFSAFLSTDTLFSLLDFSATHATDGVWIERECWLCVLLKSCMGIILSDGTLSGLNVVVFVSKLSNKPDYYYLHPFSFQKSCDLTNFSVPTATNLN